MSQASDVPLAPVDPANLQAPLAAFAGAAPPAPRWFQWAIAHAPERIMVDVEGASIEALVWGKRGAPGLMLLHGNGAHADWWSCIAPFFADTHRVVAMSWAGMGGSSWRPRYSFAQMRREAITVAEVTGLFEGPEKPIIAGHSLGGGPTLDCATTIGERLAGIIVVDTVLRLPEAADVPHFNKPKPTRVYASEAVALGRFRLSPVQYTENLFIVDFIARRSLKRVPLPDGGEGWTWKFDPFFTSRVDMEVAVKRLPARPACPSALLHGDRSGIFRGEAARLMLDGLAEDTVVSVIPDSDHHVLIDQPLALISAMRALMAVFRKQR